MKTLNRNKQTFYYAVYEGETEITQGDLHTFENRPAYGEWVECHANISPAKGESSAAEFGNDEDYDKTIVTDDLDCPINEQTVLAIDIAPNTRETKAVLPVYDYVVTKKAKSLNVVLYAVTKVKVNA